MKAIIREQLYRYIWPKIASQRILPKIFRIFSFSDIRDAHRIVETGQHFGKIVVNWKKF